MSELISTGYKRLFEIRLLHHYWLDEGGILFDDLSPAIQEKRLLTYDRRPFLQIEPTVSTAKKIAGLKGVYKNTGLGSVVVVSNDTQVADDTIFEFVVTISQSAFEHYTLHTFKSHSIRQIFYAPENKMYRFKENVFVLSNTSGTKRTPHLYLSQEFPALTLPATAHPVEALFRSGPNLVEIINEIGGISPVYGTALVGKLPVFIHQQDIPPIIPPPGLVGAPAKGIALSEELPDLIYALIRIRAVHPTDPDFSCTSGGIAKAIAPVFQVRFKNRISVWRYKNKTNSNAPSTDTGPFPITFSGNASSGQKPSEGNVKVDVDPLQKITKIVSEIFI